jgi:Flp pilus assembly protein TadG
MKPPLISRREQTDRKCTGERGVTIILVALAMVAIVAMAALSVDVSTLYLAKEEAQRSADSAALAAARVISASGITTTANPTTDTSSWGQICGTAGTATLTAESVVQANAVGGVAPGTITVNYSGGGGGPQADCSSLPQGFAVNPVVTVQLTRTSLPTFFSRIWGNTGNTVSATATAEAFNPSDSGTVTGNGGPTGSITPVQPRCVKPWAVPNQDPLNPQPNGSTYCNQGAPPGACNPLVNRTTGQIGNPGISIGGSNGVIGETFWLLLDCQRNRSATCTLRSNGAGPQVQPQANYTVVPSGRGNPGGEPAPNLMYAPGQVGTAVVAIPSCTRGDPYEEAIEGCDAPTNYQCGVAGASNGNVVDTTRNPDTSGAVTNGVMCLTNQTNEFDTTAASGQDTFNNFGAPSAYPFQILAGSSNPNAALAGNPGSAISNSSSIVSLPIYDSAPAAGVTIGSNTTTNVTFVGFLQVFINAVDRFGNVNVTVLNVAGCGNGTNSTGNPVNGSSPVPVRLVSAP